MKSRPMHVSALATFPETKNAPLWGVLLFFCWRAAGDCVRTFLKQIWVRLWNLLTDIAGIGRNGNFPPKANE